MKKSGILSLFFGHSLLFMLASLDVLVVVSAFSDLEKNAGGLCALLILPLLPLLPWFWMPTLVAMILAFPLTLWLFRPVENPVPEPIKIVCTFFFCALLSTYDVFYINVFESPPIRFCAISVATLLNFGFYWLFIKLLSVDLLRENPPRERGN